MSSTDNSNSSEINTHPTIDDKNTASAPIEPIDTNESKLKSRLLSRIKKYSHKKSLINRNEHFNNINTLNYIFFFTNILSLLINFIDIYSLVQYIRKNIKFDSKKIKRAYLAKVIINLIDGLLNILSIIGSFLVIFPTSDVFTTVGKIIAFAINIYVIPIILALAKIISGSIYLVFDKDKKNDFNKNITYVQTIVPSLFNITNTISFYLFFFL